MEIIPVNVTEKTERTSASAAAGQEKAAAAERRAVEAIGKNFIKASAESVNEALEKMGTAPGEKDAQAASGGQSAAEGKRADEAELSREALLYGKNKETEDSLHNQLEESMNREWQLLEDWQIRPSIGLEQELEQIASVYQALLDKISGSFSGREQEACLQRLNSLLLELMEKEGAVRYPALLAFLSHYGEKGAAEILTFLLLKQSGQNVVLLPKERQGGSFLRADMGGKQEKAAAQRMEKTLPEGVLYGKRDGREIHVEKGYREQIRRNERFSIPLYSDADVRQLRGKIYTGADIERTQRFLDYFTNRGDLYQRMTTIRGNEELAGFLLAENMVKAQVYSEYAGVGKSMGKDIRQAFQRFINYYLEPGAARHGAEASALREPADMGKVRRIYYHIIRIFMEEREPGKILEKGLKYAIGEYYGSVKNKEGRTDRKGRQSSGFFSGLTKAEDAGQEWEKGKRELERDWNRFLTSVGGENNPHLQWSVNPYSPWGMLLEPEKERGSARPFSPEMLLPLLALLLLVMVVVFLFQGG